MGTIWKKLEDDPKSNQQPFYRYLKNLRKENNKINFIKNKEGKHVKYQKQYNEPMSFIDLLGANQGESATTIKSILGSRENTRNRS